LQVNGEAVQIDADKGYARLARRWHPGDRIVLELPMPVRRVSAHPSLRQAAGKVALQRGPLVYCLEQVDNGSDLHQLALPADAVFRVLPGEGVLGGKQVIQVEGVRRLPAGGDALYRYDAGTPAQQRQALAFVPYFCWANRGEGEMRVWVDTC